MEEQGEMDSNQVDSKFCPGCAEPFVDGDLHCELCNLPLNEKPGVITIGIDQTFEIQKKEKQKHLVNGAKSAHGTNDFEDLEKRIKLLNLRVKTPEKDDEERNLGLLQLQNRFRDLVQIPGKTITILDDNTDHITLVNISHKKSEIIVERLESINWDMEFSEATEQRSFQLLTGVKTPTLSWFKGNLKDNLSRVNKLIHATVYHNAPHSKTLDEFIENTCGYQPERILYPPIQSFQKLIQNLCDTAPFGEDVMVLSAITDKDGNVTYNDLAIFPGTEFIKPDQAVKISLKSNSLQSTKSRLLFYKGKFPQDYIGIYQGLAPGGTQEVDVRIGSRNLDSITVNNKRVTVLKDLRDLPTKVNLERPTIEVFLILDTIVDNQEEFDARKDFAKSLIEVIEKHTNRFDIRYHLYSYSCDVIPEGTSRPKNWPPVYTYPAGDSVEIEKELNRLRMSGPGPHLFPGRLELVFKEIAKIPPGGDKNACLFIIGNRPASPSKEYHGTYGVPENWEEIWARIKLRFSTVQVFHDKDKNSYPENHLEYFNSFWDSIQVEDERAYSLSMSQIYNPLNSVIINSNTNDKELEIPSISVLKG
jgi:hypothetical protein